VLAKTPKPRGCESSDVRTASSPMASVSGPLLFSPVDVSSFLFACAGSCAGLFISCSRGGSPLASLCARSPRSFPIALADGDACYSVFSHLAGLHSVGEGVLSFFDTREARALRLVCREILRRSRRRSRHSLEDGRGRTCERAR
jgi:hypothetical protein